MSRPTAALCALLVVGLSGISGLAEAQSREELEEVRRELTAKYEVAEAELAKLVGELPNIATGTTKLELKERYVDRIFALRNDLEILRSDLDFLDFRLEGAMPSGGNAPVLHLVRVEMPAPLSGGDKEVLLSGGRGYVVRRNRSQTIESVAAEVPEAIVMGRPFVASVETVHVWAPNAYVACSNAGDLNRLAGRTLMLRSTFGGAYMRDSRHFATYATASVERPVCKGAFSVESNSRVWTGVTTHALKVSASYDFDGEEELPQAGRPARLFRYRAKTVGRPESPEPDTFAPVKLLSTDADFTGRGDLVADHKGPVSGIAILAGDMRFFYEPLSDRTKAVPLPPPHEHPTPPESLPEPETGEDPSGSEATAALDRPQAPSDADIERFVDEWLAIAEPPQNVTEDAALRYDPWGRLVGSTQTGTIRVSGPPDGAGSSSPSQFAWARRDDLDSVDHCTLGEYVPRKVSGEKLDDCAGRYEPVAAATAPTAAELIGLRLGDAAARVTNAGFTPAPISGGPAPSPELAGTVASVGSPVGDNIELVVYTLAVEAVSVPDLSGVGLRRAADLLAERGLQMQPELGEPAPSRDLGGVVYRQDPGSSSQVAADSSVRLWVHPQFVEVGSDIPPPPPPPPPLVAVAIDATPTTPATVSTGPPRTPFDCGVGLESMGVRTVDEQNYPSGARVERLGNGRASFACSYRVPELDSNVHISFSWIEEPYVEGPYTFRINCEAGLQRFHMRPGEPGVDTAFVGGGGSGKAADARVSDVRVGSGARQVDLLGAARYEAIAERMLSRIRPFAAACPKGTSTASESPPTATRSVPLGGVSGGCLWIKEHRVNPFGLPESGVQVPSTCQCMVNGSLQLAAESRCADKPRP